MACLNCLADNFINDGTTAWLRGPITFTTPNGVTLTQTLVGANPGIVVAKGAVSQFFAEAAGTQIHYLNWGTPKNYIAILKTTAINRYIILVNTFSSALSTNNILSVAASSAMQGPFINYCKGEGGAIMTIFQTNFALWASDGSVSSSLCSGTSSQPAQTFALATATTLEIHNGAITIASCARPVGKSSLIPSATINFPDVVIGPGVPTSLSTQTKQAKIKNTGNNCLTIAGVSNNLPYTVVPGSFSRTLPATLLQSDEITFDILFNPGTITGSPFNRDLAVNPVPASGDTLIHCHGVARSPQLKITTNGPVSFGTIKVGNTSNPKSLRITNTGEGDLNLLSFPAPTTPEFDWTPPATPMFIAYGTFVDIPIIFKPASEGTISRTISFTTNGIGSPHNVTLTGKGCVPNAIISIDGSPVILGDVQKGFRTVRMFKITNAGDDILTFDARIQPSVPGDSTSETDATFFGLLEDETTPVTTPLRALSNISITPVTLCGSTTPGVGEFIFGITFFADDSPGSTVPRTVNAILEINDTSPGTSASFFITLTARITNPVSVDVELVIDRSASMSEASGSRIKITTAIDAAKLFARLMRPNVEDRLGLVRFNNLPEVIPSYGIQAVTTGNQNSIENQINSANFSPSGSTAIAGGVIVAENDIINNPRVPIPPELNKIILVLTDGKDNTPYKNPADGITYSLLGGWSPWYVIPRVYAAPLPIPTDMKIYAIGIGDNIDTGRLGQLAASTGGVFMLAREFSGQDYFNLEKHFTQVYMEAVNYSQISDPVFDILPGETHRFEFEVLRGDKSAMVVIYDKEYIRVPFWISTPLGEIIDLSSVPAGFQIRPGISPTARFIEINMPQGEPDRYAGTWKVVVVHDRRACSSSKEGHNTTVSLKEFGSGFQPTHCEDNYNKPITYGIAIGVGSNFNMIAFVTPGIVKSGDPILLTAMVSEFGLPVKGCTVNVEARRPDGTLTRHVLYDDGNHQDDEADDGTYAIHYLHTHQEGTYTFKFSSSGKSRDGKTISRELLRSKYVEGQIPLIPQGSYGQDKCCETLKIWVRAGILLLLIIVILLFLIWRS